MKKILLSILTVGATGALLVGVTRAYFSSTATSTGNIFSTGSLTLQVNDTNEPSPAPTVTASFGGINMKPGDSVTGFVSLDNIGTIDIDHIKLSGIETTPSIPDLAGKLNLSAKIDTVSTCNASPVTVGGLTTLAALNTVPLNLNGSALTAGSTKYLCMTFTLDTDADSTYAGKSITNTFSFEGDQDASQ